MRSLATRGRWLRVAMDSPVVLGADGTVDRKLVLPECHIVPVIKQQHQRCVQEDASQPGHQLGGAERHS